MAYAIDLKSIARKGLRVRLPPAAPFAEVAQLIRALPLHGRGHQFESGLRHHFKTTDLIDH